MCRSIADQTMAVQVLSAFLLVTAALSGYCEATFQWSCSAPDMFQSGALYVPDIPASLNGIGTIELTSASVIYLYPVPSLNCQGRVTGVEYCYQKIDLSDPAAIGSEIIFTVLILSHVDSQGQVRFQVDRDIPIPTPNTPLQQCSAMICCDSYTFTNEQFDLPQGEFNLGILTPSSGHQIVAFHSTSQAQYRAPGYLENAAGFDVDTDPTITVGTQKNISLRVFRFVVSGTLDGSTTESTNSTNTTLPPPTTLSPQNSAVPIAVGVVVGVLVAVVLIVVIVVMIVMYYRKYQTNSMGSRQTNRSDGNILMASPESDSPSPTHEDLPTHDYEEVMPMQDIAKNTLEVPLYETVADDRDFGASSQNPAYGLQKEAINR